MLKSLRYTIAFIIMLFSMNALKSMNLPAELTIKVVHDLIPSRIDDVEELKSTFQAIRNFSKVKKENYELIKDSYVLKKIQEAIIEALPSERLVDQLLIALNRKKLAIPEQLKALKQQINLIKQAIKAGNTSKLREFLKQGLNPNFLVGKLLDNKTTRYQSLFKRGF